MYLRSIPYYFRWLSVFSWFKYANEGLQINQWADIDQIQCNRVNTTCPRSGHAVLESNNFIEVKTIIIVIKILRELYLPQIDLIRVLLL